MLTDIVHMQFTSTVLWNKTSLILYMLYVSSILFGVLCGIESVKNIVLTFKLKNYYLRLLLLVFCHLFQVLLSISDVMPA